MFEIRFKIIFATICLGLFIYFLKAHFLHNFCAHDTPTLDFNNIIYNEKTFAKNKLQGFIVHFKPYFHIYIYIYIYVLKKAPNNVNTPRCQHLSLGL
jgi:hypothetical protein